MSGGGGRGGGGGVQGAARGSFPQCGNYFSTLWKNPAKLFHCVEKSFKRCRCARYGSLARPAAPVAIELAFARRPSDLGSALAYFPLCGKIVKTFSIAWKNRAVFSTLWKSFFHTVEK